MPEKPWSPKTRECLIAAGWYPGRREESAVAKWRNKLARPGGFEMSPAAEAALLEFGGLRVKVSGPGVEMARSPFEIDPMLAMGEEDCFRAFEARAGESLFPLGEFLDGPAYLGIGPSGRVYLVGDFANVIADDMDQAVESLASGRRPKQELGDRE